MEQKIMGVSFNLTILLTTKNVYQDMAEKIRR